MPVEFTTSGATVESCVSAARNLGYGYAGVQFQGQCYAGDTLGYSLVSESDCNTACIADATETCGGGWRSSIYSTREQRPYGAPTPSDAFSRRATSRRAGRHAVR